MKGIFFTLFPFFMGVSLFAAPAVPEVSARAQHQKFFRPANVKPKPLQASPGDVAVVNSASFLPGVSPGGLATIFGQNLTDISGVVAGNTNPYPTQLSNVSVAINGTYAAIYAIAYANGEDQISVQVPYETPTGLGMARVQVYDYGNLVADINADSFDEDPGIFTYGANYALALRYPDYTLIGPNNAASPGDTLILYTTGLGPSSQNIPDGYAAPSDRLANTIDPFQVNVAGEQCNVFFSGLAPGFVGLYQINLQLPSDLPPGNLNIQISSPYASSQVAMLPVQ